MLFGGSKEDKIKKFSERALECIDKGKYKKAISLFQDVLKLDPGSEEANLNLAFIFSDQGKASEAIERFHAIVGVDCLEGDPMVALDHWGRGFVGIVAGERQEPHGEAEESARDRLAHSAP